jgi:sugar O-acyltransferase (sialic acid O-acetyltransferase NeuD family)
MMNRILCFGAGGHAAVLIDALQEMRRNTPLDIVGLIAREPVGEGLFGVPYLGTDEALPGLVARGAATHFVVGIGMLRGGDPLRERLFVQAISHSLEPFTLRHPSAVVSTRAEIGPGACLLAGAVVQPRARIGMNVIVNTRASIDHDCIIGDHVHVAPGATLSGEVRVGRTVQIGAGAVVRNGMTIGDGATIGAGAVLVGHCPAGVTMIGTPARPTEKTP